MFVFLLGVQKMSGNLSTVSGVGLPVIKAPPLRRGRDMDFGEGWAPFLAQPLFPLTGEHDTMYFTSEPQFLSLEDDSSSSHDFIKLSKILKLAQHTGVW